MKTEVISFDQIIKKKPSEVRYDEPYEIRAGVRDLSLVSGDDRVDLRFRKKKQGMEVRVYSRGPSKPASFKVQRETCNLGHTHEVMEEKRFHWATLSFNREQFDSFVEWINHGTWSTR